MKRPKYGQWTSLPGKVTLGRTMAWQDYWLQHCLEQNWVRRGSKFYPRPQGKSPESKAP